ncbi:MAG: heterocyst development glycosyltransferase HepC [Phormidesmis sp.]
MTSSTALLKMPRVLSLAQLDDQDLSPSRLLWRQQWLLIKLPTTASRRRPMQSVPALQNRQWFEACLARSPVKGIRADMSLGEETIRSWAMACRRTHKRIFVCLPSGTRLPKSRSPLAWGFKRLADWLIAASLLVVLSPLFLMLAVLVRWDSPGPIFFRQWRIGYRGELFQILKFRTMQADAEQIHHQVMGKQSGIHKLKNDPRITRVGRWLRKYSLDELPQLLNVLRGEMSLVGPRPWALYDAIRIEPALQGRLNALPGITGAWQVTERSNNCNLSAVSQLDLDYLKRWTVLRDFQLLLMTVPKVFSGLGAY